MSRTCITPSRIARLRPACQLSYPAVFYTHEHALCPPTSDIFVCYLLGSTGHETLFCDFINAHLVETDFEPVESISIETPFNLKKFQNDKESVLDVRVTGKDKRIINVDIQSSRQMFYLHRSLYYWARLYQGQLQEGANYAMLAPVVRINILDFIVFNTMNSPHTCFVAAEKNHPGCLLTDALQIHFYKIPQY